MPALAQSQEYTGLIADWRWGWLLADVLVVACAGPLIAAARLRFLASGYPPRRVGFWVSATSATAILSVVVSVIFLAPDLERRSGGWLLLLLGSAGMLVAGALLLLTALLLPPRSTPLPSRPGPRPRLRHYRRWVPVAIVFYLLIALNLWFEGSRVMSVVITLGGLLVAYQVAGLERRYKSQEDSPVTLKAHESVLLLRTFTRDLLPEDEKVLSKQVRRQLGELIALGDPRELLPAGGARRVYLDHDEWRSRLTEIAQQSKAIVVWPDATSSVRWELGMIRDNGIHQKLFVLVPPRHRIDPIRWTTPSIVLFLSGLPRSSWEEFAVALREKGLQAPALTPGPGSLLTFAADGSSVELARGCSSMATIVALMARQLQNQVRPEPAP